VPVEQVRWQLPYLPIDPHDVGRTYEAVIRVNSQSGKGGVAYIMQAEHSMELPRRLQIEFSRVVQDHTDTEGGEVTADRMWEIFEGEYLANGPRVGLLAHRASSRDGAAAEHGAEGGSQYVLNVDVRVDGEIRELEGVGNGPISAFVTALSTVGIEVRVLDYQEHAMSAGGDAKAAAYVECQVGDVVLWGVGIDANIITASLKAVLSAIKRATRA
jgi:2-isopropylmalate synthase